MRITLSTLLLMLAGTMFGQQYLYLQKDNDIPHTRLELKDRVKFKTADTADWTAGILHEITSESITVGGVTYPLKEIVAFRTRNSLVYTLGSAGVAGGALFTGIFLVNGLINSDSPVITNKQIILGASLVSAGFLVRWLSRKTFEKEDGWKWNVIDLEKDF